ncbi:FAD-binding domain-containing protein [Pholiota conissans]|uniref:FAD-binding domain-containing protein n=1 Tax=Pholiota conissans TaxID=109636 RepID=A0A9P5Z669_9AGAR|nr:FAD-binding domain-containing protein [Pholiota conissans]
MLPGVHAIVPILGFIIFFLAPKTQIPMAPLSFAIKGRVLTAEDGAEYLNALNRFSHVSILKPQHIFFPAELDDIPPILNYATSNDPPIELAVKGGGIHSSAWASSDGGIVIDLAQLNKVALSPDNQSVIVQGGAVWGDVYKVCQEAKLEVVGSPLWFVGVGGFTLGGGYGPLSGEHGLAIDNLLSAIVVLADGRIVRTSPTEEPELFWAIRGGGNQFGIVVEFTFKTHPSAGPFTVGTLIYDGEKLPLILKAIQDWKANQTANSRLNLMFFRPGPSFAPKIMLLPWIAGSASNVEEILAPFRRTVTPLLDKVNSVPDMFALSHGSDASFAAAPKRLIIRGLFIADIWGDMMMEVFKRWRDHTEGSEDVKSSGIMCDLTFPYKITEIDPSATASHVRRPHYWFSVQGRSNRVEADDVNKAFVASVARYVREYNTQKTGEDFGAWISMAQGDESAKDIFGDNLSRLRRAKARYDPQKVWTKGIVIEPASE